MRFQLVVSTVVACIVSTVYFTTPLPTYAATRDTRTVRDVVAVAQELVTNARILISDYYKRFEHIQQQTGVVHQTGARLQQEAALAQQTHTANERNLHASVRDLYALETAALSLPEIVALHEWLLKMVERYKQQVGLPVNAYDPQVQQIEGHFAATRNSFGTVIDAQAENLVHVKRIVDETNQFINTLQQEFHAIAGNNPHYTQFGIGHYFAQVLERIANQRATIENSVPFLAGTDIEGNPMQPLLPCQFTTTRRYLSFTTILAEVLSDTAYAADYAAWLEAIEAYRYAYYGNPHTLHPGWVNHWRGCIQSQQDEINVLRSDIRREMDRGNIDLAAELDELYVERSNNVLRLESQSKLLNHFASQATSVVRAVAQPHISSPFAADYPDAWRHAVRAYATNLQELSHIYPVVFRAARAQLGRAEEEILPVLAIGDDAERDAALLTLTSKIASIKSEGLERISQQLQSSIENLRSMARQVRRGEIALYFAIDTYLEATALKFYDMEEERDIEIPLALRSTREAVRLYEIAFDNSFQFIRDLELRLEQYERLRGMSQDLLGRLHQVVAVERFNPIYTELVRQLIEPVQADAQYLRLSEQIDEALRTMLQAFNGIQAAHGLEPSVAAARGSGIKRQCRARFSHIRGKRKRKKVRRCIKRKRKVSRGSVGGLAKQLASHKDHMSASINRYIDDASRQHLEQETVSELLHRLEGVRAEIASLQR